LLITSRLVVDFVIGAIGAQHQAGDGQPDPSIVSASGIIRSVVMLTAGSVLVLLALANLGVEVTPLITGLGIGGIAVALAAQSILGDLFGSLTILLDKPFLVGDFIIVGDQMGTIEKIGIKTTRVRALSGEQLVFSNTDLLSSRIRNFKRMYERRVVFSVGVVYETPVEKLQRIPEIIRQSILTQPQTRFDRAHFNTFGAYSLNFEAVYFVTTPDYNRYMDIQQAINLELVRRFGEEHIEFAYPTQVEIYRPAQASLPTMRA
jgi:small-conductance mechanosensitive channel